MRKRYAMLIAAGALAVGMLSLGLATRAYVDASTGRYPGSQVAGLQTPAFYSPESQSLVRHGTYQTADALLPVQAWYAERMQVLASENVATPGGNCAWMARSRPVAILQYSASVLLCSVPGGTRITLDESVALGL